MLRVVRPEILDSLPHDHPDALRNRRELRAINALMGSHRWLERQLRGRLKSGGQALELGAGSGDLARRLRRRGVTVELDGLDLCPAPADWSSDRRWWREDLNLFDGYDGYDAVVGNLILHQFDDAVLATLGERMSAGARFLFFSEPARRVRHIAQFRALALFGGMGHVSRNDGEVSIRAGFVGDELPRALGLNAKNWSWKCSVGQRGQYFMSAWRKEAS